MNDNKRRSVNAEKALAKYTEVTGSTGEDQIVDFLADLQHLCKRRKLNFAKLLNQSQTHYVEETKE